jgi:hypothetical protein
MTYETVQVYSGTPVSAEELLVLAEFAAPSHFFSDAQLHDAAENLVEWTDREARVAENALQLAAVRHDRPSVVELLREAVQVAQAA